MKKKYTKGGARPGAGRKPLPEGVEKKEKYSVSLHPSYAKKVIAKFGSITKAVESLELFL
jgi:hypothetical protein